MSFANYYLTLQIGLGITALVIVFWFMWASSVYRYSSERIASKLLSKYKVPVQSDQTLIAKDGVLNANKTASASIYIREKNLDSSTAPATQFTLMVKDDCSPLNNTCVSL